MTPSFLRTLAAELLALADEIEAAAPPRPVSLKQVAAEARVPLRSVYRAANLANVAKTPSGRFNLTQANKLELLRLLSAQPPGVGKQRTGACQDPSRK